MKSPQRRKRYKKQKKFRQLRGNRLRKMKKLRKERSQPINLVRECGECSACCYGMQVIELNKPSNTPCLYECGGCTIYNSRPAECKHFECLWKIGIGGEEERPDKLGFFLYLTSNTIFGELIVAVESKPGAFEDEPVKRKLEQYMTRLNRLIYLFKERDDERILIGPLPLLEQAAEIVKKEKGHQIIVHEGELQ